MFACIYSSGRAPALDGLFDLAYTFSPRVEQTAPDTVLLEIDGLERLFGPPVELAEQIVRLASDYGLRVEVGIAANPEAALHAARGLGGIAILPPGQEARLLAAVPVSVLSPPPEIEETLKLWGIRTLGQLAALPEAALSERLGAEGLRLRKLARAAGDRALLPFAPLPGFENSLELECPVALLEPLLFILARLLNQLWAGLEARALATDELRLRLKLVPGPKSQVPSSELETWDLGPETWDERVFRLPFPLTDHRAGLKLMQLELEQRPPKAAVTAVWLAANPVKPRVQQEGLFVPLAPAPDKLEITLARIANLVGGENVGAAELLDTHRPGAFRMKKFVPNRLAACDPPRRAASRKPQAAVVQAFRVFRPPLSASVETRQGRPERVAARGIHGRVIALAGPWRSSGDWWKPDNWDRDEWDVALSNGALYRLYCDRASRAWFVEGSYD